MIIFCVRMVIKLIELNFRNGQVLLVVLSGVWPFMSLPVRLRSDLRMAL